MISRFSSLKSLKNLQTTLLPKVSNKSAHPIPKEYIASTLDELSPKRATMHHLRAQEPSFSGSQFVKQTQEKAKELLHEFVHMVVHGSKSAYKDAKYLYSVTSSKSKNDYTVQEIREVKRITVDLVKFVPFYAAVIIPAGELALLPYLYLFPRAIPSYFLADKVVKENKDQAMDKQFAAQQHLKQHLLDVMAKAGYDVSVRDPESMRKFFVENQDKLMPLLETSNMSSEMLKHASDFLMFEYVEGTYILNLLYKTTVNMPKYGVNLAMWIARNSYRAAWNHPIFNYSFKLNSFPFEGMKKQLLKYQFQKQLNSLNSQNYAMQSGLYGKLSEESVMDVAQERGYYANNAQDAQKWLEENWNQTKGAQTNMSAFWYSVIQYESL